MSETTKDNGEAIEQLVKILMARVDWAKSQGPETKGTTSWTISALTPPPSSFSVQYTVSTGMSGMTRFISVARNRNSGTTTIIQYANQEHFEELHKLRTHAENCAGAALCKHAPSLLQYARAELKGKG